MKFTGRIKNILLPLTPFVLLIILWYAVYYFNIFPQWLIPSPWQTAETFLKLLLDGSLVRLTLISAFNIFPAFVLGLALALIGGVVIGLNADARKAFFPFFSALYTIPSIAWLPFVILFLGFNRQSIWAIIVISSFLRMIYNVIGGVRNVNPDWILAAKNLGLNKIEVVIKIIIPAALPHIITGMRLGFNSAWRSLIAAEMLITTFGGLGKFIWFSQWSFNFDKVFSGIIIIATIGIVTELFIFKRLEKVTLVRWGFLQEELG